MPELCGGPDEFLRGVSTARAVPTPARQLLTAQPSTWRTSTARASPHSPSTWRAGSGSLPGGRGQSALCDFTLSGARLARFAVDGAGHCTVGAGGSDPQCKVGRRRCKQEEGGRAAAWRSHAAAFCPQPRLPKLQTAHCKARTDSNTDSKTDAKTDANRDAYTATNIDDTNANTDANTVSNTDANSMRIQLQMQMQIQN